TVTLRASSNARSPPELKLGGAAGSASGAHVAVAGSIVHATATVGPSCSPITSACWRTRSYATAGVGASKFQNKLGSVPEVVRLVHVPFHSQSASTGTLELNTLVVEPTTKML